MNDNWKLASPDYGVDKEVDVHIIATVFRTDLDMYVDILRKEVMSVHIETTEIKDQAFDEGWYQVEAWGIVPYEYSDEGDDDLAVEELRGTISNYADIDKIEIV